MWRGFCLFRKLDYPNLIVLPALHTLGADFDT